MTSLAQKLGLACKDAREHAGLNQTELAALHEDVQQSHISRMEKGVVLPSLMSMLRIEKLCGLPPGWILNRAGVIELGNTSTEVAIDLDQRLDGRGRRIMRATLAELVD